MKVSTSIGSSRSWSRRALLLHTLTAGLLAAQTGRGTIFESVEVTSDDPFTEFGYELVTDPSFTSLLPALGSRFISPRRGFALYSSNRPGSMQVLSLDLESGERRQLTTARALDPASVRLLPDDQAFLYFDGESLMRARARDGNNPRELYRVEAGWKRGEGLAVNADGRYAVFPEINGPDSRIRLVDINRRQARTLTGHSGPARLPVDRPGRRQALFRDERGLWMTNYVDGGETPVEGPRSPVGSAYWSADGATLTYLHTPADPEQPGEIREWLADNGDDRLVVKAGPTQVFVPNADTTAFACARGGRSDRAIALLLRSGNELTLADHGLEDLSRLVIAFSPDSQTLYFHSNRDGEFAIYRMPIADLLEPTGA